MGLLRSIAENHDLLVKGELRVERVKLEKNKFVDVPIKNYVHNSLVDKRVIQGEQYDQLRFIESSYNLMVSDSSLLGTAILPNYLEKNLFMAINRLEGRSITIHGHVCQRNLIERHNPTTKHLEVSFFPEVYLVIDSLGPGSDKEAFVPEQSQQLQEEETFSQHYFKQNFSQQLVTMAEDPDLEECCSLPDIPLSQIFKQNDNPAPKTKSSPIPSKNQPEVQNNQKSPIPEVEKPKDQPKPQEKPKDQPKPQEKPKDQPKSQEKPKSQPKSSPIPSKNQPEVQKTPKSPIPEVEKPKDQPKPQEKPVASGTFSQKTSKTQPEVQKIQKSPIPEVEKPKDQPKPQEKPVDRTLNQNEIRDPFEKTENSSQKLSKTTKLNEKDQNTEKSEEEKRLLAALSFSNSTSTASVSKNEPLHLIFPDEPTSASSPITEGFNFFTQIDFDDLLKSQLDHEISQQIADDQLLAKERIQEFENDEKKSQLEGDKQKNSFSSQKPTKMDIDEEEDSPPPSLILQNDEEDEEIGFSPDLTKNNNRLFENLISERENRLEKAPNQEKEPEKAPNQEKVPEKERNQEKAAEKAPNQELESHEKQEIEEEDEDEIYVNKNKRIQPKILPVNKEKEKQNNVIDITVEDDEEEKIGFNVNSPIENPKRKTLKQAKQDKISKGKKTEKNEGPFVRTIEISDDEKEEKAKKKSSKKDKKKSSSKKIPEIDDEKTKKKKSKHKKNQPIQKKPSEEDLSEQPNNEVPEQQENAQINSNHEESDSIINRFATFSSNFSTNLSQKYERSLQTMRELVEKSKKSQEQNQDMLTRAMSSMQRFLTRTSDDVRTFTENSRNERKMEMIPIEDRIDALEHENYSLKETIQKMEEEIKQMKQGMKIPQEKQIETNNTRAHDQVIAERIEPKNPENVEKRQEIDANIQKNNEEHVDEPTETEKNNKRKASEASSSSTNDHRKKRRRIIIPQEVLEEEEEVDDEKDGDYVEDESSDEGINANYYTRNIVKNLKKKASPNKKKPSKKKRRKSTEEDEEEEEDVFDISSEEDDE